MHFSRVLTPKSLSSLWSKTIKNHLTRDLGKVKRMFYHILQYTDTMTFTINLTAEWEQFPGHNVWLNCHMAALRRKPSVRTLCTSSLTGHHDRWFSKHSWTSSTSSMVWDFIFLPCKCCLRWHSWVCPMNSNICFIWSLSFGPRQRRCPRSCYITTHFSGEHQCSWITPVESLEATKAI